MTATKVTLVAGLLLVAALSTVPAQRDATISDADVRVIDLKELKYAGATVNAQGVVVVRVTLDKDGKVANATALSGAPILAVLSVDNVKKWRFSPNAEKAAIIVYNFRVKGFCNFGPWPSQMIFYPPNYAEITACGQPPVPSTEAR
jgi:Gram-negative bacterial TonB protein C-terminal